MANNQKHTFAIFVSKLNIINNSLSITDEALYHRIVRVLRLNINDLIILFDKEQNALFEIQQINKKDIILKLLNIALNKSLFPSITVCISLLKKESFEEALYSCVELGANKIQPIITQKSSLKKITDKDIQRFEKILISASEQSKNFSIPKIEQVLPIDEYLKLIANSKADKIFFDAEGQELNSVLKQINNKELILLIGPEGDLTDIEKSLVLKTNFILCKLTPTILRAQTAVVLSIGIFRSLVK